MTRTRVEKIIPPERLPNNRFHEALVMIKERTKNNPQPEQMKKDIHTLIQIIENLDER